MSIPILETKLFIPAPSQERLIRSRLHRALDAGLQGGHHLILVSAPAGFGKTTLIADWLKQVSTLKKPLANNNMAWFSLDSNDNELNRFLLYLVAALQQIDPDLGRDLENMLQSTQSSSIESSLTILLNQIATLSRQIVIVLDDYHLITNQFIHKTIEFFIENLPTQAHLVIITRADPPLPLARLRARGQMSELRAADLRFTLDETTAFLDQIMGLGLSTQQIAALETRTEGWIVGLQMAALTLRGKTDLANFIQTFSGSNKYILDYLMEEVVNQQSDQCQEFLLSTSILDRMNGKLCEAVSGQAGGQEKLEALEQANLFLVPLDDVRGWYRYHHLFGDFLKATLRQRKSEEEIRLFHHLASLWHQSEGFLEEAMIHAMAAQDYERAASMIDENIVQMLSQSEGPVLLRWIEKLPEEVSRGRPWVDIYRAYTLALSGRPDQANPLLRRAEERIDPDSPRASELMGHIAAIRSYNAHLMGDIDRVVDFAMLAEECLPEDHLIARGMSTYALAVTYFANDEMKLAVEASQKMLDIGKKLDRLLMVITALCDLASVSKVQGELHKAEEYYASALQWLEDKNGLDSRLRCPYEVGLADLMYQWNRLDEAYQHAVTGIEYCQRYRVPSEEVSGQITLMYVLLANGDIDRALEALRIAEKIVQNHYTRLAAKMEFNKARLLFWLAIGDMANARRSAYDEMSASEVELLALVRLRLALGQSFEARSMIERQEKKAHEGGRTGRLIEILALKALAAEAQNCPEEADELASRVLSLAVTEGYYRVFLDLGEPCCRLIKRLTVQTSKMASQGNGLGLLTRNYLDGLIKAFEKDSQVKKPGEAPERAINLANPAVESLTERELEVLQLVAQGLSNAEIASQLVFAASTAKQHLKNIYGKLNVHNRTQAVSRGRELGLL